MSWTRLLFGNGSRPANSAGESIIKSIYFAVQGSNFVRKSAVIGALTLYLDFINMFTFMLHFMGDRR